MLEPGSLAIEAARAAIGEVQAAAQRVHRLTQGRVQSCADLVAALQRWPSFAVADPWAIETPMAGSSPAPESQSAEKRAPSGREASRSVTRRSTSAVIPPAVASAPRPATLSPLPNASRPLQAPAPPSTARGDVDALGHGVRSAAAETGIGAAASQPSALAAVVAQAIARHAAQEIPDAAESSLPWSDLLPPEAGNASRVESTSRRQSPAPGESPAVLQALDLPTRAALDNVSRADSSPASPTPVVPAAEVLRRLLPDALPEAPSAEPATAAPLRTAAPRAPSRLLSAPAASTATSTTPSRLGTPARTPPDDDEDAAADTISRQLAHQAWLRGTDFT